MNTDGKAGILPPGIAFIPVPYVTADVPHAYWTLANVARALGTGPRSTHRLAGVSTDTRAIRRGDCFVALVGEKYDAHEFLSVAKDRGAAAFVVSNAQAATGLGIPTYVVEDTQIALGALATAWRRAWSRTVIAVAGSNGKTSTKDMLKHALGSSLNVHATVGNLNNLIGVPLTLLAIPAHADVAIVELGTNAPGEIATLRAMAEPNIAVLTSIGEEHLEGLGDLAGVLREETEVFRGVELAVVPAAYPDAVALAKLRARHVVTTGFADADVVPASWGLADDGSGWFTFDDVTVQLSVRGEHQVSNALLVLAVMRACGVALGPGAEALRSMPVPNMRGAWENFGAATLLNDAYNSNPASARAALVLLNQVGEGRQRVAVLGSMRELGSLAMMQHEQVARAALESRADVIAAVGDFAAAFATVAPDDPRVVLAPEFEHLWGVLEPRLQRDAVILLKASRGAKMERLIPFLSAWASQ
ncbi:MAG: UDP-N-acetylmuramoyl-tripeptide--D-alanyl-D-alanine ligase [Gemmatimonadota bacterium]|nr:UDP-N-acetylmuramoyl-tripeptide--D-alanyl-D-alanine ligase [Gemmatimonadota bacterium]